jgi:class 3 adenylate cyclase/tetratricopeptide (TPR) repeat protein
MPPESGLRAYVPRILLEHLVSTPEAPLRVVDGTVVFVDVSGFTRLSERLARRGREGAERLADAIDTCFAALLAVAYDERGSLLKFGGDALLLLFDGPAHAERGCRAAAGMRAALRDASRLAELPAGATLRMSVGVHSGEFTLLVVGGANRELLVTGPAATRVVRMEQAAEAGQILLSPETAERLPTRCVGRSAGPGRLLRQPPPATSAPPADTPVAGPETPLLGAMLSRSLREHVLNGPMAPEHRLVSVGFVKFGGVDDLIRSGGAASVARDLAELVDDVHSAAEHYGVCVLGSDVDTDGGKLILTAGAPTSTGDDGERMLLTLRSVLDRPRERLVVRAGVNHGPVFAGDIGPAYRRTYTVMGDAVNLSARLMAAAAGGELYATPAVTNGSRTRFAMERLAPMRVKGKARPVEAVSIGAVLPGRHRAQELVERRWPLVGRGRELEILGGAAESARRGQGRVVELVGEPGIGKTRLLEELRAVAGDMRALHVTCEPFTAGTPYLLWRRLLRQLLGISADLGDPSVLARLRTFVAAAEPELAPWLPLLAIPLGIAVPPTPESDQLDEENRRQKLREVLVAFLASGLASPSLIEIEDAHNADPASADLLGAAAEAAGAQPWLIAVSRRESGSPLLAPLGPHHVRIDLQPVALEATRELAEVATARTPLPPRLLDRAAERSGGNTQFLRDLLRAMAAGGGEELPETVEAAATALIDRLPARDRDIVRRAAVLGRSFDPTLVPTVLDRGQARPDGATWARLREVLEPDGDWQLRFRRQAVWEAAYGGLPFRVRRSLHAAIATSLEGRFGVDAHEHAALLALHFHRAADHRRTWDYARIAGERALSRLAPAEAADAYRRALEAAKHVGTSAEELRHTWEALGGALTEGGELDAAHAAFRSARGLAEGRPVTEARLLLRHAELAIEAGRIRPGVRWAARGLRALAGLDSAEAAACEAHLLAMLATIRQRQGRPAAAIGLSRRAMRLAEETGEDRALAHACYVLDWALVESARSHGEGHAQRALEIYRRLGDLGHEAAVLNNLGGFAYREGRWADAVELYLRAAEASARSGSAANAAFGDCNVGELLSDQGHADEGESLLRRARQVWKATGYDWGVAYATAQLGRLAARCGRHGQATARLLDARSRFTALAVQGDIVYVAALQAEAAVFAERPAEARTEARRLLEEPEVGLLTPLLWRVHGAAHAQQGDPDAAREALRRSVAAAREQEDPFETLLALDWLAAMSDGADADAERRALTERLAVAAIARPPLAPPAEVGAAKAAVPA